MQKATGNRPLLHKCGADHHQNVVLIAVAVEEN